MAEEKIDVNKIKIPQDGETIKETLSNIARINQKEPNKMEENWRNPDGTFKEGHPDAGGGRSKGKTLKEWLKDRLQIMTDEERDAWLKDISKDLQWRMAEGNPHNTGDITSTGKPIPILSLPVIFDKLDEIHKNHRNDQDTETNEED